MANFKDFAVGLVGTTGAPSPATTGTSITLRAGDGVSMPTPPFYVTATPPGQLTTLGTSEKLLVTAVSGDTLTVVRAQDGTTAKSIAANWIIANAMYASDVTASSIKMDELMTGTVNGTNKVFTTASAFTAIVVYKNGVTLHVGDDYTITGSNQITMVTAPATGAKLTATYILGTSVMISGSNGMITHETPAGAVNGTNTAFTTARPYIAGSLQVFVNGLRQSLNAGHYTETTPGTGIFTLSDAPSTGDVIGVQYQFVSTVSGNSDTVDGYHANATPTANQIPVLDSNGKMPDGTATVRNFIQKKMSGTTTVTSTATTIGFDTIDLSSGTKLTASGSSVVVGAGVSVIRVSYNIMSDNGGTASYLFSRIRKNGADWSQQIDGSTSQFKATSETRLIPVTNGDVITVAADSGGNSLIVGRMSVLLVEAIA